MVISGFPPISPHLSSAEDPRARCSIPGGVSQEWSREAESLPICWSHSFWCSSGFHRPSRDLSTHQGQLNSTGCFSPCPKLFIIIQSFLSSCCCWSLDRVVVYLGNMSHYALSHSLSHSLVLSIPFFPCQAQITEHRVAYMEHQWTTQDTGEPVFLHKNKLASHSKIVSTTRNKSWGKKKKLDQLSLMCINRLWNIFVFLGGETSFDVWG